MNNPDPFIQKIRQTLDQHAVDASTRQQLAEARQSVLEPRPAMWRMSYAIPAMAMASVITITLMITMQLSDPVTSIQPDSIETFEILTSRDDLELYENLDFYLWLDQQPKG